MEGLLAVDVPLDVDCTLALDTRLASIDTLQDVLTGVLEEWVDQAAADARRQREQASRM